MPLYENSQEEYFFIVSVISVVLVTIAIIILGFRLKCNHSSVVVCCLLAELALLIQPALSLIIITHGSPVLARVAGAIAVTAGFLIAALIIGGLLYVGRSYRPKGTYNTLHFKIIVGLLSVLFGITIPTAILSTNIKYDKQQQQLSIAGAVVHGVTLINAIIYAFFPVIAVCTVHSTERHRYAMDARYVAMGTWYALVAVIHTSFRVVWPFIQIGLLSPGESGFLHPNGTIEDGFFILIMGLPAPRMFVTWVQRKIMGRTVNRYMFLNRGVLSNGILEGRIYDDA